MSPIRSLSLAAALLFGGADLQEEKPCDVSKTELREYCATCRIWPASVQIEKGACLKCRSKVERIETCIKVCWDCPKIHATPRRHAKDCRAAKGCCKETPSLAIVSYFCDVCKSKAAMEAAVKHVTEACEGTIKKTCAESGKFPHGGNEER
jgi:hypothetical protein